MTSLAEVYEGVGADNLRRLYLGTGLFVSGAILVVIGIIAATTDLIAGLGLGTFGAREIAGITAGLGVPAVFVGIFTVLPASRRERAAAAIGASVAVFGVMLFAIVYPEQWYGAAPDHLTLPVTAVYFLGTITTFWALFTAVVNFKTRNDPGGTVTLKRTIAGETQQVEVPVSELEGGEIPEGASFGSVGVVGGVDRDPVLQDDTESTADAEVLGGSTGRDSSTDSRTTEPPRGSRGAASSDRQAAVAGPASDGGTATERLTSPGSQQSTGDPRAGSQSDDEDDTDRYCGTCSYFDYNRTDDGIQPYCGFHDELMADMDPCDQWRPNTPR